MMNRLPSSPVFRLFLAMACIISVLACSLFNRVFDSGPDRPSAAEPVTSPDLLSTVTVVAVDDDYRFLLLACGKYGYINRQGETVIPFQFKDAGPFREGLALVGDTGRIDPTTMEWVGRSYGYIDLSGSYLIEPEFPSARPFSEGLAAAESPEKTEKFGYIDRTGQFVIEPQFLGTLDINAHNTSPSEVDFHEGLALAPLYRDLQTELILMTYIDSTGKRLDPPGEIYAGTSFSEGLATIYTQSKQARIITTTGQEIAQILDCQLFYCVVGPFSDGLAAITHKAEGGLAGYIDQTGNRVIAERFADAKGFNEGLAAVQDTDSGLWGYIDRSGNLVIPYQHMIADDFSEGLAWVGDGFIDPAGNKVIEIENPYGPLPGVSFENGLARFMDSYVDQKGKPVPEVSPGCP